MCFSLFSQVFFPHHCHCCWDEKTHSCYVKVFPIALSYFLDRTRKPMHLRYGFCYLIYQTLLFSPGIKCRLRRLGNILPCSTSSNKRLLPMYPCILVYWLTWRKSTNQWICQYGALIFNESPQLIYTNTNTNTNMSKKQYFPLVNSRLCQLLSLGLENVVKFPKFQHCSSSQNMMTMWHCYKNFQLY